MRLPFISFLFIASGCGITHPDYIDYSDDSSAGETSPDTPECAAALAEFASQIEPVLDNSCIVAGCHATQAIGGVSMRANDAANNRGGFKAYTGSTSDKLFAQISSKGIVPHAGGDVSGRMTKTKIDAWLSKEGLCK